MTHARLVRGSRRGVPDPGLEHTGWLEPGGSQGTGSAIFVLWGTRTARGRRYSPRPSLVIHALPTAYPGGEGPAAPGRESPWTAVPYPFLGGVFREDTVECKMFPSRPGVISVREIRPGEVPGTATDRSSLLRLSGAS